MTDKELPTSPDWSKYPEKWIWFAIDCDGLGCLFTDKPHKSNRVFMPIKGDFLHLDGDFNIDNWQNSLQKRPD